MCITLTKSISKGPAHRESYQIVHTIEAYKRLYQLWRYLNRRRNHTSYIILGCRLDAKCELDTNVDISCHLDDLGELASLLCCALEVIDGENLESGLLDLNNVSNESVAVPLKFNLQSCELPPCWYPGVLR